MNRLLLFLIIAFSAVTTTSAQATWFPYPTPPENLPFGRPRANYMVEHFWDRCPWKSAFSAPQKMERSLRDFAEMIPHAAADTVFLSIDGLIRNTQKKPADFASLLKMAEATFFSDTAATFSDEVYLPFARAGATFKKFKPEQRKPFERQAKIIENSMVGHALPAVQAKEADGSPVQLNDTTAGAQTYILIFERPGADRFDRVRFAANIAVRKLTESGIIKPILICTEEPDRTWLDANKAMPQEWTVVSMADAANMFDIRGDRTVYLTDGSMKIVARHMPLSLLIANCEQLVKNAGL
ncbi:MAG: DUF5106 domain-containing protein [Muribaculaceae bacterium]|nr:DUF5106 domain-containing protein [Muribaculaceae bacterium]